ncbi:hypothetical protein [Candidatus Magnetominusculus xianensis]|uniref:Secreted protein n=1 Tax=Candidatus Magnetominusculus xianensis TaxID=1748249 RepID=A0ABR5SFS1_9BACT|nr:hypothetical protein [Candidatus Magnetominusculus xianensis]KWT84108.1 hypothetical protein ASN18_2036 [Candidatus Magnetominusculus xianensis]MBF0402402.1 hypothetical protein [Nitrospirota bacterium]
MFSNRKFVLICVIVFVALHQAEAVDSYSSAEMRHSPLLVNTITHVPNASEVDPDYAIANVAILNLIATYSSFLGNATGTLQTNSYGLTGNYYTQWFTNGMALMAWVDGYVYLYYNATWQSLNVIWNTEIADVYLIFNTLIYQYSSFFGTPAGGVIRGTSSGQNYYSIYFKNGIMLYAAPDGNLYYYLGGIWKSIGMTWK